MMRYGSLTGLQPGSKPGSKPNSQPSSRRASPQAPLTVDALHERVAHALTTMFLPTVHEGRILRHAA